MAASRSPSPAHGVEAMFTSGAHVFPMYDAAVNADPPTRLLDVRHEQTAADAGRRAS
jgi:acetolactate synthase-1/2/3 large subunit